MDALRERLRDLARERDALARRTRDLEAALSATSVEAQRRAAEAVQLQSLLDFYEHDQAPVATLATPDDPAHPEATKQAVDEERREHETTSVGTPAPALQSRRVGTAWTSAWRDAAVTALRDHGGPLHYRDLYRLVAARGFTFGGRNPEATFLASLHRDRTMFQNTGKGTYWLVEATQDGAPATAARTRRRTQRPRPIGKPKGGA